jgi:CTP synthase (UTP-ammonia lyase)
MSVRIGIVGDYNPEFVAHTTTDSSLREAAESLGLALEAHWLPTLSLVAADLDETLGATDGLWISAGSPYADRDGAFAAIRWARERDWPFVAT